MQIEPIKDGENLGLYNLNSLNGYIVYDFLTDSLFNQIKKHTIEIFKHSTTNTFLTHTTQFTHNNQKIKLGASNESKRYQNVIFDFTLERDWYFQTEDTINDYINQRMLDISPLFQKFIKEVKKIPPFSDEPNRWVCYRQHLNVMDKHGLLALHLDGAPTQFKTSSPIESRSASVTFYMHDHIEGKGGELWSVNGFVFKPKSNSMVVLTSGSSCFHGVTANMNDRVRLGFTTRWAHIDDLFLPGHPDKCLYKIDL
jgi:hypothetical protein